MSPEKTKILFKTFPLLYADVNKSPKESLMCFGVNCGDGWFNLIYKMSEKLDNIIQKIKEENPDSQLPRASQIKEKFGLLRCYMSSYNDSIDQAIGEAEAESSKTCEDCGQPGKLRDGSWIFTLCDTCDRKKHPYLYNKNDNQS